VARFLRLMWSNVIGQSRVKRILSNALEQKKLPGAYLFSGPEGTGKDAMAIELAKAVNCQNEAMNGLEACDECANCLTIASFASPIVTFVHALAKDIESPGSGEANQKEEDLDIVREQLAAKSDDPYHNLDIPRATTIQIGQIRDLRLSLSRTLSGGKKRVVIISEADMMNAQAQNAFLKTLEEPHANTLIIMTSSNTNRLYPTILSRCQDVRFDILSVEDIASALILREELPQAQADFLARLAAGSYSRARSMIGEDVQEMRNQIVSFLRMGLSKSRRNAAQQIDLFLPRSGGGKFLEKRQAVEQRLTLLTLWLRDALALSTKAENEIINLDQKEDLTKFVARFGEPRRIIAALSAVDKAEHLTKLQVQLRPVMMQLVVELEEALA
jgi:DNA polymerase-3 subunit delta'